ncbi:MAG: GNAT family N-acetyltransferase [Candidatus Bipolaricaulia bacterium]
MAVRIRSYRASDSIEVGRLIADTFREFNLSYASTEEQEKLLGPFRHAHSDDSEHQARIAAVIESPWILVAVDPGEIIGVLRGSPGRLHSLFVSKKRHGCGIGHQLMTAFERKVRKAGAEAITLQSSLYAVPFYQALGYKRSTGIRSGSCFDGVGFKYQPMKKILGT